MIKWVLFFSLLFFTGCEIDEKKAILMKEKNQNPATATTVKDKKEPVALEVEKVKSEAAVKLEEIKAQNAKELQQMQLEAKQKELEVTKELKFQENQIALSTHKDNVEFYTVALIILTILTLFIALIIYLIAKKNRETKIKMQEEQLRSEYNLKQQEFYHQKIDKLLDIASNKESDEKIKKDAISLLKNDHTFKKLDFQNDPKS